MKGYGVLVKEHNGHEIYQDGDKFYIVDKEYGNVISTSNCLQGALIVSALGKQKLNDMFKRKGGRRKHG